MVKNIENNIENTKVEAKTEVSKATKKRKTATKRTTKKAETTKEVAVDLDSILNFEKKTKTAMSFNQNKSIAEKIDTLAKEKEVKASKVLNTLLTNIVDIESGVCKVSIEEEKEEKVQNTYKIDTDVLNVLKAEAKKRNMSLNDYLNKVLEKVFK